MTDKPKHFIIYGPGISKDLMEKISAVTEATEIPVSFGTYDTTEGMAFGEFWPGIAGFGKEERIANMGSMKGSVVTIVQSTGIPYENNFVWAKVAANNAKRFEAKVVHVIFPFRDLREDKIYEDRATSIRNPMDADELKRAGADFVTFLAPHSQAGVDQYTKVFGRNVSVVDMSEIMIPILRKLFGDKVKDLMNGAPDGWDKPEDQAFGCAVKIAKAFHGDDYKSHMLGIEKKRDAPGESHPVAFYGDVEGKTVLFADDMFSGGKTSIDGGVMADAHGASEVYLAAPNGIFTKGLAPFLSARNKDGGLLIKQIITTNTLEVEQAIIKARLPFPNVRKRIFVADVSSLVIREMDKVYGQSTQVARDAKHISLISPVRRG